MIESDAERADEVADTHDCLVLNDDATVKGTLVDAGGEQADAIISTTDQDATNSMSCLLAKELAIPTIVSVVHNPRAGEYTLEDVLFEVASAQGNVGLSTGITGPESLPALGKALFLFNLWIGRLEIIPVVVTIRAVLVRASACR